MAKLKKSYDAEKSRKAILKAARTAFVKRGFEGTSISEIAALAGVNQSLIYHHFQDKEHVWKEVKLDIFKRHAQGDFEIPVAPKDLRSFLEAIIRPRFAFYEAHPDVLRMMMWQKLEKARERLKGEQGASPSQWKPGIVHLQQEGKMNRDLDPDLVTLWIVSAISGAFTDDFVGLHKEEGKKRKYLEMVIDGLEKAFADH